MYFSPPGVRSRPTVISKPLCLYLPVRLFARITRKLHDQTSPFCMSYIALAQFSFGGVAMHYVLAVLWITSYFHNMGVGRGMGVLDGWRSSKGRGSFGGKCGASHCNQWELLSYLFSAMRGGDRRALPKLLWDFLFT